MNGGAASSSDQRGFTLIELMMVVTIIGLLASVAIPAFTRYLKRSRTVEATTMLAKMAAGAQLYFKREFVQTSGSVSFQLPAKAAKWYPTKSHTWACRKHGGAFPQQLTTQFDNQPWKALLFSPEGNFRYRYYWKPVRQHTSKKTARANAEAMGDLDCNKVYSRWRIRLEEDKKSQILLRRGPYIIAGDAIE